MAKKITLSQLAGMPAVNHLKPEKDPYTVQDALRTLTRADEIRKDRPLMKEVKKMAKSQVKAVCK